MSKFLPFLIICAFITGCTTSINKPNLDSSNYTSRYAQKKTSNLIKGLQVDNKAQEGTRQRDGSTNFSESRFPLDVSEQTKITIQNDLEKYFSSTTTQSENSNLNIFATILVADSYKASKMNGTVFIPLVGMITGSDTKIGMNLKIRIEVEKDGELVKDWIFERRIDRVTSQTTTLEEDYQALIQDYRLALFEELDVNILRVIANGGKLRRQSSVDN